MQFLILRAENLVVIDNAAIEINCSALPANVAMIVWHDDIGKIEYNDRPAMRTDFTDPSPYIPFLNAWMTAFSTQVPPLQLPQAKKVKTDLVEALYDYKRREPYTYGWVYDANDEAVMFMNSTLANILSDTGGPGSLVPSINNTFHSLTLQLNPIFTTINTNANNFNTSMAVIDTWSGYMAQNWGGLSLNPELHDSGGASNNVTAHSHQYYNVSIIVPIRGTGSAGTYRMSQSSYVTDVTVGFTPATAMVAWQPLNSASIVAISVDDFNDALTGIVARNNTLNGSRVSKKSAINALASIPAVVAYDVTAGW